MSEDFSKAKQGPIVKPDPTKVRITIRLDANIIEHFKKIVHKEGGGNYQTLINDTLRRAISTPSHSAPDMKKMLRQIIREELSASRG